MPGADPRLRSSLRQTPRAVAHHFAAAVSLSQNEQLALGVRCDEETRDNGDTLLLRLTPGNAQLVAHIPGIAHKLVVTDAGLPFVLDRHGDLTTPHGPRAMAARAIVAHGGVVAAATDDGVFQLGERGDKIERLTPAAHVLAASTAALLAVADDDHVHIVCGGSVRERHLNLPSRIQAIAVEDSGRWAVMAGRLLYVADCLGDDARPPRLVATVPFTVDSMALFQGRLLVGSRSHGLFVVADHRLVPLRPSLKARTLSVRKGILTAASDLFVASSEDGADFVTRDLTPLVRLSDGLPDLALAK